MKKKKQMCSNCKEETWHMIGKKQSHNGDTHYNRRSTSECIQCGRKEINNKTKGKRVIHRNNESSCINKASLEVDNG